MSRASFATVVGITSLATFFSNLSSTVIYVPMPEIVRAFGGGELVFAFIAIAYLVPFAVIMPVIAKIGDVYGQKRVFLFGLGLYALTSLLAGLTLNFNAFIALRTLQGLGGGIILVSMVFIVRQLPEERHGVALGVWRAALLSGTVGGPVLGGYIAAALGWPAIFWTTAPVAALLWVWAAVSLQELPFDRARRFDWIGATAFMVAFFSLVIGLASAGMLRTMHGTRMQGGAMSGMPMEGGGLLNTITERAPLFLGVFLAGLVVLAINQKTNREPLFDASLLRNRPFILGNLGTFFVCVGMFAAMMFAPLELRNVFGYSELQAANILVPMAVTAIVFGVWGGRLTTRFGIAPPWAAGFVFTAASFIALANLGSLLSPLWLLVIAAAAGVGQGLPLAPTAVAALTGVPAEASAEATGLFNFSHNMGRAVALGGLGALLFANDPNSYASIFWVSALSMVAGAALTLGLPKPAAARLLG